MYRPTSCSPCVRDFPAAPRQITNCGYSEVPCYFHWLLLNAACGSNSRMCKPIQIRFCIEFIKIKNISRDSESEVFTVKCAESECRLIAWTECSLKVKCDDLTVFGSLPLCLAKHFISCREPPPSSEKDQSCRRLEFWHVPLWYQDGGHEAQWWLAPWLTGWVAMAKDH